MFQPMAKHLRCDRESASLLLAGCAAYQVGSDSLYAPDVATVYVPMIESDSYRRDLGERLTEAVVKEIELKTPYKVVGTPDADSILSAQLLGDSRQLLAENSFDDPRLSEIELSTRRSVGSIAGGCRSCRAQTDRPAAGAGRHRPNGQSHSRSRPIGRHVAAAGHRAAGPADRRHDGSAVVSSRCRRWHRRACQPAYAGECDDLQHASDPFPVARRCGNFARARSSCRGGRC